MCVCTRNSLSIMSGRAPVSQHWPSPRLTLYGQISVNHPVIAFDIVLASSLSDAQTPLSIHGSQPKGTALPCQAKPLFAASSGG